MCFVIPYVNLSFVKSNKVIKKIRGHGQIIVCWKKDKNCASTKWSGIMRERPLPLQKKDTFAMMMRKMLIWRVEVLMRCDGTLWDVAQVGWWYIYNGEVSVCLSVCHEKWSLPLKVCEKIFFWNIFLIFSLKFFF